MSIFLSIPAVVAVAGVLTYALGSGKLAEIGKMAFVAGLTALLLTLKR
jgi:uncharacterized membrane protein